MHVYPKCNQRLDLSIADLALISRVFSSFISYTEHPPKNCDSEAILAQSSHHSLKFEGWSIEKVISKKKTPNFNKDVYRLSNYRDDLSTYIYVI